MAQEPSASGSGQDKAGTSVTAGQAGEPAQVASAASAKAPSPQRPRNPQPVSATYRTEMSYVQQPGKRRGMRLGAMLLTLVAFAIPLLLASY